MKLRRFDPDADFEQIRAWAPEKKAHAMWCANRFPYPLERNGFLAVLSTLAQRTGDIPFSLAAGGGQTAGFFCFSPDQRSGEGKLKFVIVDPAFRGTGAAQEMLRLACEFAFQETGADRVSLSVFSLNHRAKRAYEKAGFTEIKTERAAFAFGDERWDRCLMTLGKSRFAGMNGVQNPAAGAEQEQKRL